MRGLVPLKTPSGFGYQSHRCIVTRSGCQKLNTAPLSGLVVAHFYSRLCGVNVPST